MASRLNRCWNLVRPQVLWFNVQQKTLGGYIRRSLQPEPLTHLLLAQIHGVHLTRRKAMHEDWSTIWCKAKPRIHLAWKFLQFSQVDRSAPHGIANSEPFNHRPFSLRTVRVDELRISRPSNSVSGNGASQGSPSLVSVIKQHELVCFRDKSRNPFFFRRPAGSSESV